jgi:hypothetical protein
MDALAGPQGSDVEADGLDDLARALGPVLLVALGVSIVVAVGGRVRSRRRVSR